MKTFLQFQEALAAGMNPAAPDKSAILQKRIDFSLSLIRKARANLSRSQGQMDPEAADSLLNYLENTLSGARDNFV
jgi:hypothetical protein